MPRLRALVAAALTVGAVLVPRAGAAPDRVYVLTGSTTAYIDVAFYTPMTFRAPIVSTRGRYGGFLVQQLSTDSGSPGRYLGGWVAIRGLSGDPERMDPVVLGRPGIVEPGMVRVYLIADGPTTVRFERDGGPQGVVTFRPKQRTSAHARVAPMRQANGVWSGTVPLRVAPDALSIAATQVDGRLSVLADVTVCLRRPHDTCPWQPLNRLYADPGLNDPLDPHQRWVDAPPPGSGLDGNLVASARVTHVDPVSRAAVAGFTLALVAP